MSQKNTKDFLIRKMPIEVYLLLEKAAKEHHRSKTQEAISVLEKGLISYTHRLQKPEPFLWKKKPKSQLILKGINEGRL